MTDRPLWQHGVTEIAEAVRTGRTTAVEVIEAHLARIDDVNPVVNAITVVFAERARALAVAIDARLAAGEDVGPLAGVPFCVKENIDLTWSASTNGWTFLADAIPSADATMVARLMDAGAIPIARGNMPDFGLRWDTDNDLFGRTYNPWDRDRVPGRLERWRRGRCRDRHGSPRTRQRLRRVTAAARVRGRRLRAASVSRSHSCAGGRERAGAAVAAVLRRQRPDRAQRR